jgi:hypothetical protein
MFLTHKDVKLSNLSYAKLQDLCEHVRYNSVVDFLLKPKNEYCNFLELIHPDTFYRIIYLHRGKKIIPILETCGVLDQIGGMLSSLLHDYDRQEIESGNLNISNLVLEIWNMLIEYDKMTFIFPYSNNSNSFTNQYMNLVGFKFFNHDEFRIFSTYNNPNFDLLIPASKIFTDLINTKHIYVNNISHFNFDFFKQMKLVQKKIITSWLNESD